MLKFLFYNAENNVDLIRTSGTEEWSWGDSSQPTHGIPRAAAHPGHPLPAPSPYKATTLFLRVHLP